MTGLHITPTFTWLGSRYVLRTEERREEIHCSVQVLVDAPCPDVKKENAFEDTLFLIDILRQTKAKENKQKKVAFTINITLIQV